MKTEKTKRKLEKAAIERNLIQAEIKSLKNRMFLHTQEAENMKQLMEGRLKSLYERFEELDKKHKPTKFDYQEEEIA